MKLNIIKNYRDEILQWSSFISLILVAVGFINRYLSIRAFRFLTDHLFIFFSITIALVLLITYLQVLQIKKKLTSIFVENLKGDLHQRWDINGDWQVIDGSLMVTNSDAGGITKIGSFWENYEFEFETRIIKDFSGWIVRAEDINNYFMFQINSENLRPHLRIAQPDFNSDGDGKLKATMKVGWHLFGDFPHNKNLKDKWFKVKTVVSGAAASIFVEGDLIFHQENILSFPTGKIGFREYGDEKALFRNIKVRNLN